jgi:hypothetical protein
VSRPQLSDLVLDALRELADAYREYHIAVMLPNREDSHPAYTRYHEAQEQLQMLACGLFPPPRKSPPKRKP